jgi:hypothetical protein
MINVYDLTNGTTATLFAIFALWAVASNRHWFVRTAVVAAAILITLLIPAYEVLITFLVEVLLVAAGIFLWRRRRTRNARTAEHVADTPPRQLRLSMETLMLAVVIVAVTTAVAARMPVLAWRAYYSSAVEGLIAAATALASVWLIYGNARWQFRLAAVLPIIALMALAYVGLQWGAAVVQYWIERGTVADYLKTVLRDIWPAILSFMKPVTMGIAATCVWLYLVRRAGWFDPFGDRSSAQSAVSPATRRRANAIAFALFIVVAIFPLVLLYQLLTPTPFPAERSGPNGFNDFIAAGKMIDSTTAQTLSSWDQLSTAKLRAEIDKLAPAFTRVDQGLQKDCWNPYVFRPWPTADDLQALQNLTEAFRAENALARRDDNHRRQIDGNLRVLKLARIESSSEGIYNTYGVFARFEPDVYQSIWQTASSPLAARKLRDLMDVLVDLDNNREPWSDHIDRQRIIEENAGWDRHLRWMLAEWSGEDSTKWQANEEYRRVAMLRMLIIKLAILAHQLDHDRLPQSLSELVPEYLRAVPEDPFSNAPFRFQPDNENNGYKLYSFGPDRDDDNGSSVISSDGDLTDVALFPPRIPPEAGAD